MKNFKALATAVLIGGSALLTGCGEIDPNAITLQWEGDDIGYFQCDRNEYQPAAGSKLSEVLDSNKWYNGQETLAGVFQMEGLGDNVFGALGGAIFTGALFARGEELCAENGLGPSATTRNTAPPVVASSPVLSAPAPTAPAYNPTFEGQVHGVGDAVFTNDKGETTTYTYTSEFRGAASYIVTYSDGVQVMYETYVNGVGEIRTKDSEGYWSVVTPSTWTRDGDNLTVVSEKGSTVVFYGFNFSIDRD